VLATDAERRADANPTLERQALARAALRIGRQHIASVVNTLVLAYTGAALPLLLLAAATRTTAATFVNAEVIAEEIARTIAGTTALIALVPIATWVSTYAVRRTTHRS